MMALAPIVITALVLTIILQIVLIILVLDTKKKNKFDSKGKPLSAAPEMRDLKKPRELENRFNNRRPPSHDQRVKPSPAAAQNQNIDSVERSLRDINLRLKNAERDQEKERRRIKDTIATPPQKRSDFNKPRERNEVIRRNDRPRQDFSQQRPAELPKLVREERPNGSGEPREIKTPSPVAVAAASLLPSPPPVKPIDKAVDTSVEMDVSNSINNENLQHGRKIMVKRRVLKAEDEQTEGSGKNVDKLIDNKTSDTTTTSIIPMILSEQTPSENAQEAKPSIETITAVESKDPEDPRSDEPISFGR